MRSHGHCWVVALQSARLCQGREAGLLSAAPCSPGCHTKLLLQSINGNHGLCSEPLAWPRAGTHLEASSWDYSCESHRCNIWNAAVVRLLCSWVELLMVTSEEPGNHRMVTLKIHIQCQGIQSMKSPPRPSQYCYWIASEKAPQVGRAGTLVWEQEINPS